MPEPITFYFEYASPYSYLATHVIDDLAEKHGRTVHWRPIRLRDVWQAIGRTDPSEGTQKVKLDYIRKDAERCAALSGLPFVMPARFPPDATLARVGFYRLDARDSDLAHRFAKAVAHRVYGTGQDISALEDLSGICGELNLEPEDLAAALDDQEAQDRLAEANDAAVQLGYFGVPWIVVDGESFFGHDRLPYIERWLESRAAGGGHQVVN